LDFVRSIRRQLNSVENVDIVVCPPFVALPAVSDALRSTKIGVGAQNMYYMEKGAFTGECAPDMLTPYCQYVILGHSERRAYFSETDDLVNNKVKAALDHALTPIICVGESLEQNEAGLTDSFVGQQVNAAFDGLTAKQASGCIIAYEPIWAIGTGKSATPADAGRIIGLTVRGALANKFTEEVAQLVRVQYGGSANPSNIGDYMAHPDIDGALVGGASLKPDFVDMVKTTSGVYRI